MARRTLAIPKALLKRATVRKVALPVLSTVDTRRPAPRKVVFSVAGRPVPWSVSRRGTKEPTLIAWQLAIHLAAQMAMEGRRPMDGRVKLMFIFRLHAVPEPHQPDVTNLQKACEDALQGSCFVNDKRVRDIHSKMDIGNGWQGVSIIVESLGD